VVDYDNSGNELILVKDQKTRQNITLPRAHVIPISPLKLADYVPEADLSKIDWNAENVKVYDFQVRQVAAGRFLGR
jgi:hypothetical protein